MLMAIRIPMSKSEFTVAAVCRLLEPWGRTVRDLHQRCDKGGESAVAVKDVFKQAWSKQNRPKAFDDDRAEV